MYCKYCGAPLSEAFKFCSSCGRAQQPPKHPAQHHPSGEVSANWPGPKAIPIWCWSSFLAIAGLVLKTELLDIPFSTKYFLVELIWGTLLPALSGFGAILYTQYKNKTTPIEYSTVTAVIFPVVVFALHYGGVIASSMLLELISRYYIVTHMDDTVSFANYIGLDCLWNWLLILYFAVPFTPPASVKRRLAIGVIIWSALLLLIPTLLYGQHANTMDIRYFFLGWGPRLVLLWFAGLVVKNRMGAATAAVFALAAIGGQALLSILWIFGYMGFPKCGEAGAKLAEFFAYLAGVLVLFIVRKRSAAKSLPGRRVS